MTEIIENSFDDNLHPLNLKKSLAALEVLVTWREEIKQSFEYEAKEKNLTLEGRYESSKIDFKADYPMGPIVSWVSRCNYIRPGDHIHAYKKE